MFVIYMHDEDGRYWLDQNGAFNDRRASDRHVLPVFNEEQADEMLATLREKVAPFTVFGIEPATASERERASPCYSIAKAFLEAALTAEFEGWGHRELIGLILDTMSAEARVGWAYDIEMDAQHPEAVHADHD